VSRKSPRGGGKKQTSVEAVFKMRGARGGLGVACYGNIQKCSDSREMGEKKKVTKKKGKRWSKEKKAEKETQRDGKQSM